MMIPVIIGVTFLIFFMMDLAPGDATDVVAMEYSEEALQQLREDLHLDEPLLVRYFIVGTMLMVAGTSSESMTIFFTTL